MLARCLPALVRRSLPVALVGLSAVACGEGFDRAAAIDGFQAANPEVSDEQAACVVDRLTDRYGLDGLADELGEAGARSQEFTDAQFRDMFACGVDGDVEDQLTEQLAANGVAPEDAPCVAAELTGGLGDDDIDVLLSGEITDDFMAKFVGAMERCGALGASG